MHFLRFCSMVVVTTLIISLIAISPSLPTASACPPPPVPLRLLCKRSDLIVAAKTGNTEIIGRGEEGFILVKVRLQVISRHKGDDSNSTIYVHHIIWDGSQDSSQFSAASDSKSIKNPLFPEGDTVLLFLVKKDEGEGYFPYNFSDGVKRLADDALKIYTQRIDEFVQIIESENPKVEDIIDWLIRCVEEPATRWEGTNELLPGKIDYISEEKEDDQEIETDEEETSDEININAVEISDEVKIDEAKSEEAVEESDRDINEIVLHLTPGQRERLENVLFNIKELNYVDLELASFVSNWALSRVVEFLIPHLSMTTKKAEKEDTEVKKETIEFMRQAIMLTIAYALEDEKLKGLAKKYNDEEFFNSESDDTGDEHKEEALREEASKRLEKENLAILERFIKIARKQIGQ